MCDVVSSRTRGAGTRRARDDTAADATANKRPKREQDCEKLTGKKRKQLAVLLHEGGEVDEVSLDAAWVQAFLEASAAQASRCNQRFVQRVPSKQLAGRSTATP